MRAYSQNIFVAFLLGIFCLQVFLPLALSVSIGVNKISQREFIRENNKDRSAFETVVISKEEYEKQKMNSPDEIEIDGMMYDVHSVSAKDGKYVLTVLTDEKETELKKVQSAGEKEERNKMAPVFLSLFVEKPLEYNFVQTATSCSNAGVITPFYSENVKMIAGPPPDLKA